MYQCGQCYFALRKDNDAWAISTSGCSCGTCAANIEASCIAGSSIGAVVDRRARLAERHNTEMLDQILGVDEEITTQAHFVPNRVPVLLLRRMLLRKTTTSAEHEPTMPDVPLAGYCRDRVLPHIFCSFSKTVSFLNSFREAKMLFHQRVIRRRAELAELYSLDVPDEVVDNTRSCIIMAAAMLRIVVASDMKHEVRTNVRYNYTRDVHVQNYEFQLQLFIDTHLDLLVAADIRGICNDDAICEPMSVGVAMSAESLASNMPVHDILRRSIFVRAYPHPLRAPSALELPDMTNSILSSDLWTKASDNTRSNVSELIHNFQSKTQNHRCAGRNIAKMVCEMWGYNPPTLSFVTNILELHSLGNYPGVVYRPGIRARKATRRAYSLDKLQSEPWCAWCHYADVYQCPMSGCENKNMKERMKHHKSHICPMCKHFEKIESKLIAAVREFFVFTVRVNYVVDYMMRVDSEWTAYTNVVGLAANESRSFIEKMYGSATPLTATQLVSIQAEQIQAIELVLQCNKSMQRLRKDYMFAELMLRMCNHAHTFVVCPTWSGSQRPEDFLLAPLERNNNPYEDERLHRLNACFASLAHLDNRRWCDVFSLEYVDAVAQVMLFHAGDVVIPLLHMLGVSPEAHEAVTTLYTNSEWRNMPDNSFKSACIELYNLFPVDFHVIHYLLIRIVHYDQFKIMTLDERSAIAQVKALRRRHCLMPQQPLPQSVERLYFCDGEWRVYGDIVEPLTEELVQKAVDDCGGDALAVTNAPFGTGPKGALYSNVTKKLHCTRPPSSSITKKLARDGFLVEGEFFGESEKKATKVDKKTAKSIRVAQRSQRDCSKPLRFVSMIGKLVRIGSRLYTLCTVCASPFVVTSNNLSSDGFVCGRHVQILEPDRYTELRQYVNRHNTELKTVAKSCTDMNCVFPLTEKFTTIDRNAEKVHTRISRVPNILFAPSHVRPKAPFVDKMYCVGTPCFAETKFRANRELVSLANQIGSQLQTTRTIVRRFGERETEVDTLAKSLEEAEKNLLDVVQSIEALKKHTQSEELARLEELRVQGEARVKEAKEKVAEATRIVEAAAAAVEAAEAAETKEGLTKEQAERMSNEAISSGVCLQRVAIICAFCYRRCERHSVYTRLNVIDLDGAFVEPLWQRRIPSGGRLDVWLCENDFDKIFNFIESRPQILASEMWDELVEMKHRAFNRRLVWQQSKK